jgi:hypothetical protein
MSNLSKEAGNVVLNPGCFRMHCTQDSSLSVNVEGEVQPCIFQGQVLTFAKYSGGLVCPDPEIVCGVRRLYDIPDTIDKSPSPSEIFFVESPFLMLGILVFACGMGFVVVVMICHRRRARRRPPEPVITWARPELEAMKVQDELVIEIDASDEVEVQA